MTFKEDGKGLKIVRQSLPYGTASGTHGLYFCAYCARLYNIEQQLLSIFGRYRLSKRDAMLRFTCPVTGGYYFAPSVERCCWRCKSLPFTLTLSPKGRGDGKVRLWDLRADSFTPSPSVRGEG
ncbi:Dyp-type peroxidase [Klebsiella pneumoniae]|nr:Dyp-type peroxidase [Klebsiella pneumoniae]